MLVDDLAGEFQDYVEALPRDAYRRQLHAMLLDLAEFHHGDLDDSVVPLVAETLDALEPIASPSAATIGDLARRWETVLEGLPARTYNATSLCRVLSRLGDEFDSPPVPMSRILVYAIVGDDIRPQTTAEYARGPWVPKVADEDAPEIRMLRRFIASAVRELEKAGVARPTEPSWVASLRELGIRPKMDGFRHSYAASTGDRASDD